MKRRDHLGDVSLDWGIKLKHILKRLIKKFIEGSFEHDYESLQP
jgi:hypothetical protein